MNAAVVTEGRVIKQIVVGIVVEEADETVFWLEMIAETAVRCPTDQPRLLKEANELKAIFSKSLSTMRSRIQPLKSGTTYPSQRSGVWVTPLLQISNYKKTSAMNPKRIIAPVVHVNLSRPDALTAPH